MGKTRDLVYPTSPSRAAIITPLYVCPGSHDRLVPRALFSIGDILIESRNCPLRDCCLWYAGHDLGETAFVTDFPPDAVLPARFHTPPFECEDFKEADESILTFRPQEEAKPAKPPEGTLIVVQFTPDDDADRQSSGR